MRKVIVAVAIVAVCVGSAVHAQKAPPSAWPTTSREAKEFNDKMPNDVWLRIAQQTLNLQFLIGKPIIAVFNSTEDDITNVKCDGKWTLIGNAPYIKGAPARVAAHTVVFAPTDKFDSYCKMSLDGTTDSGEVHKGILSIPGDFTNSVSMTFK